MPWIPQRSKINSSGETRKLKRRLREIVLRTSTTSLFSKECPQRAAFRLCKKRSHFDKEQVRNDLPLFDVVFFV